MKRPWDWEIEAYSLARQALEAHKNGPDGDTLQVSQKAYTATRNATRLLAGAYSLVNNRRGRSRTELRKRIEQGARKASALGHRSRRKRNTRSRKLVRENSAGEKAPGTLTQTLQ